jgi:hypothetical protein
MSWSAPRGFFLPLLRGHALKMFREGGHDRMRFLWTYLVVVIVFAFGFLCASAFSVEGD